jgi:1,2-phenylacetyl-CoA epoxidase catalytic subunit
MTTREPAVDEVLQQMLTSHAYRERLAMLRFTEAAALAPDEHSRVYVTGVGAEEAEHYRACLATARTLGVDVATRVDERFSRPPIGIPIFHTWLDVLLAHALNDEAGLFVLRGLVGSRIPAYAALARHIVDDEALHGSRGREMLLAYWPQAPLSDEVKLAKFHEHVQAGVRCLGRPNTPGDTFALRAGLKTIPAVELIAQYGGFVASLSHDLGIPPPSGTTHGREGVRAATAE